MKQKIFTLLLALITTMSLLAIGRNDGSNMANAIDYDWDNGTMHYSGTRWYYMDLVPLYEGADSLHFHITNLSNTESVDVIYKMTIAGQMDSVSLTLAPHGVYTSPNMDANMLVRMHLTHLYFTVSSMGNVQLNWQLVFPGGDSCEESKHGGGFQEAGTKWYDIKAPDRDENEVMEYYLSISFLNIDEDYYDNDISNTISLNFKTDCNSPAFYDTTFTIDPASGESVLLYNDQLAALGWPDLLFSCTSSTSCRIEHTYYSYVPGESCYESIFLNWEPVEQSADLNRWYALNTYDGTFNPIIPDTCDLRIKFINTGNGTANVNADVYFDCREEERIFQKSYVLEPFGSDSFDIDRDFLERFVWPLMIYNVTSDQNISIHAELIPDMPRDTIRDTIVAYVCYGETFVDETTYNWKTIGPVEHSMTWIDTVEFRDGLQMKDSIITFYIHPLVMPEPLSAEEMRGIGAAPLLVQGLPLQVTESNAALTEYYRNLGNSVDLIVRIDTAYWAKPVYKANGDLDSKKEAPLDLSKYYSKNEYMDTLLLVVKSEECYTIMRIEYIFPIEEYKYVFRNDTICPPGPYYNPDTLTSIVLDTLGLPRMVDTITIYYSMLQPALYSQDEISLLPVVANGQPIDTTFTIYALKQQFAADATDLTARVTNIKWQVLEGDVWMDMPYVVSQTATEIHMRYIVETECAIRDTSMNIILPLTPEPCLIASGTCGNNLTWTLTCDSVLTISGTGAMWSGEVNLGWRQYLSRIRTVILPDRLSAIAPEAFYNCVNLQSVNVPNSVHAIGHKAFVGCESLTEPVYNATIFAFMPRNYCGAYSIPEGIVSVAAYAFNCVASEECIGVTEITIPSSVERCGVSALGMPFLQKMTCYAVTPPTCDSTTFSCFFEDIGVAVLTNRSIPVYVPAESVAAYQAAEVWKEFLNILPIEETVEPKDSIYDVVYLDQTGLQLDAEAVTLHLPDAPEIEGFTFLKWQIVAGDLVNGINIQAVYEANEPSNTPYEVSVPGNKAQKLIRNGNVYILIGDKTYMVTGHKVR